MPQPLEKPVMNSRAYAMGGRDRDPRLSASAAEARVVVGRLRVLGAARARGVLPRPALGALPHGRAVVEVQALPAAGTVEGPPILGHVFRIIIRPPMDRTEEGLVRPERPARVEAAPDVVAALT